jgi:hypothetical protein
VREATVEISLKIQCFRPVRIRSNELCHEFVNAELEIGDMQADIQDDSASSEV